MGRITMLTRDLYCKIILNEETAVKYLREHNLLEEETIIGPCHQCGTPMQEKRRRNKKGEYMPILRCPKRKCQTTRSIRSSNAFFHYTDLNGKLHCNLKLCDILELVYFFILELPTNLVIKLTGKSSATVIDWFNMCRKVCSTIVSVDTKGKMIGTKEHPIRIDEIKLIGRQKSIRRKNLLENDDFSKINGNQSFDMNGPWILGLIQDSDYRYFYVEHRNAATLIPIIERECAIGSIIQSKEWNSYGDISARGFYPITITMSQDSFDSSSVAKSQTTTENHSWLETKIIMLRRMRGASQEVFQSHLDHLCWKILRNNPNEDLFVTFLDDIRTVYRR